MQPLRFKQWQTSTSPASTCQAGTYTLYVAVKDPENWKLIINKQTDQNGDSYDPSMDLGRADMKMENPPAPIES